MPKNSSRTGNDVLARLSRADFGLLDPHLETVDLPLFKPLETGKRRIETVYFIERGFASVVANGPGKRDIEVGLIGREGMTGLAVLGHDRCHNDTYMQAAGTGRCLKASKLRQKIAQSASLHRSLLSCVHAFLIQSTQTALANGRSKDVERLARWLLMAQDRLDGNEVPLTHTLLAVMLGVQRPAVSVAVQALERKGLIKAGRRVITIINRNGLAKFAKGTYVPPH